MPPHSSKAGMYFSALVTWGKFTYINALKGLDTHKVAATRNPAATSRNWGRTLWVFLQLFIHIGHQHQWPE